MMRVRCRTTLSWRSIEMIQMTRYFGLMVSAFGPMGASALMLTILLLLIDEAIDPNTLCPFCSRSLPSSPSSRLARLKTYLLDRPHIYPQATARNPQAMYLPAIETANFCRMHDREVVVIPEGLKRGWPQTHDWTGLPK